MIKHNILFIGLDTHKAFVEVAYIEDDYGAQAVHYGRVSSAKASITKLAKQFQSKYPDATLHFVYEAGPCGYWIYRLLTTNAPLRGNNTWVKIRSEATEPSCYCPRGLATGYSGLLCVSADGIKYQAILEPRLP